MEELLEIFAEHTDMCRLRVRQFSGVIFLCGGATNGNGGDPASARDFFLRRIKTKNPELFERIFLAEEINNWADHMVQERYTPDLLTLESHVSRLASAVSLIVESPGSIAELGSFCLLTGVPERLMGSAGRMDASAFFYLAWPNSAPERFKARRHQSSLCLSVARPVGL